MIDEHRIGYQVDECHVIGVNGTNWEFYDDVWDKLLAMRPGVGELLRLAELKGRALGPPATEKAPL